jgi:small subunit ribosomal protein S14
MAKQSKIVKNNQRAAVVAKYAERRVELKRIIRSPSTPPAQRTTAQRELAAQPRDASPVRLRRRDAIKNAREMALLAYGSTRT